MTSTGHELVEDTGIWLYALIIAVKITMCTQKYVHILPYC